MWFDIFIFVTMMAGSFVQTATGFGCAIIIMSMWPMLLPVPETTQLLLFGTLVQSGYVAFKFRRHINFKIVTVPLILALAGTCLGITLLLNADNTTAVRVIGIMLIVLAVYFLVFNKRISIPENIWTASMAGAVSGVLSGFFNIAGPPIVLYYSAAAKDKEEYTGTVQFLFAAMVAFKMVFLGVKRGLSEMVLTHAPFVIAGSTLGMILGLRLFSKLSTVTIKKMVYILMIVAGIWYILRP